jgi:hypothetical protein
MVIGSTGIAKLERQAVGQRQKQWPKRWMACFTSSPICLAGGSHFRHLARLGENVDFNENQGEELDL